VKEKKKSAISWILTWAGQKRIAYVWSVLLAIGNVIFKILPYFIIADVVKLFLNISKKEQEKRISRLTDEKDTAWRVGSYDLWQNEHYEKCLNAFDSYLKETNLPSAPWYIIDAESKKWTELQALEILTEGIDVALANNAMAVPILQNVFSMEKMPLLSEIPLDKTIGEDEYKKELKRLQNRLGELHNRLYRKGKYEFPTRWSGIPDR